MQNPVISEILQDPTTPEDPELFEARSQAMSDELCQCPHAWAFAISRYISSGGDSDRLVLLGLLKSYRKLYGES